MRQSTAKPNEWFTSSYSSGNGQCVQVKHQHESTDVRDSVHPDRAMLNFSKTAWQAFLGTTRRDVG